MFLLGAIHRAKRDFDGVRCSGHRDCSKVRHMFLGISLNWGTATIRCFGVRVHARNACP